MQQVTVCSHHFPALIAFNSHQCKGVNHHKLQLQNIVFIWQAKIRVTVTVPLLRYFPTTY